MSLKLAIIGGGSSYSPEMMEGLLDRYDRFPLTELWLVDVEAGKEKLEIIYNLLERMIEKSGRPIKLYKTLDRVEAIKGADFVATQFRVGLLEARIRNERLANNYGMIGQETNSITGLAKLMMTAPVIIDICKEIEEYAKPNCFLLNFTNPSGRITETIIKHTKLGREGRFLGLCNVPIGMKKQIAENLDIKEDSFTMDTVGMNHFIFITDVILKEGNKSVLKEAIDAMFEKGDGAPSNIHAIKWMEDQIRTINSIPCGYLKYYFHEDESLAHQMDEMRSGKGTRGEQVKEVEKSLFELYKDPNLAEKPKELEKRGGKYYSTVACDAMCSIYNDEGIEIVVSTRNNGELDYLPEDVSVELNCKITKDGATPINSGNLKTPKEIKGLIQLMKSYDEIVVEGAVKGDKALLLHGLQLHPLVRSGKVVETILNELIEKNKDYLPQFK